MINRSESMRYTSGFEYQLVEDFFIQTTIHPEVAAKFLFVELNTEGMLIIKKGWAWDGASGPTLDTKSCMIAAMVHDALYGLMKRGLLSKKYKDDADLLFYDLLIEDGMWKWRAKWWYRAVRNFGCDAVKKPEKVKEAP